MFDFFGLYELCTLALIVGAFTHGYYSGRRDWLERGVEGCLRSLEEQGLIKIVERENGDMEISSPDEKI